MKFYRCSKSFLRWKEMNQISLKWELPILIDPEHNVVLGNSFKDSLPDTIIVTVIDNNRRDSLFEAFYKIEEAVVKEGSEERIMLIRDRVREYLRVARRKECETMSLFDFRERRCITPELYIEPPPYEFNKHKAKEGPFNDGCYLSEDFIEELPEEESEIKVDLEILKELL